MGIKDARQILDKMQSLAGKMRSEDNEKSKRRLAENLSSLAEQFRKNAEKFPS